ncbi:MAG: glycerophosphodiester phosphodiesterase [Parasporobacterium sp.]|nr:glycerophosphodiester phosphodiesterase [Parasporobacterium sp.]
MTKQYGKECFYHVYFAHRGLHDISKGIPENSLTAFRAAADAGYAAELDVRLSKDGKVVIFHDNTLERVCKRKGSVADYDYSELKEMSLYGTDETIPLLTDVLSIFQKRGGPLLVELKAGDRSKELCQKTYALLKTYPGVYCIESFHPFIVNWFRKNAPEVFRGQLSGFPEGYRGSVPYPVALFLSACSLTFLNKPDFIAYEIGERPARIINMQKKGIMMFGWTSRTPDADKNGNDALIFENYRPPLKY